MRWVGDFWGVCGGELYLARSRGGHFESEGSPKSAFMELSSIGNPRIRWDTAMQYGDTCKHGFTI